MSEIQQMRDIARQSARHAFLAIIFGWIALLGILPLSVFFVLLLGRALGDQYALSSLLISLVLIVGGGLLALRYYGAIWRVDLGKVEAAILGTDQGFIRKLISTVQNPLVFPLVVFLIGMFFGEVLRISAQKQEKVEPSVSPNPTAESPPAA